jgi:multidrug efflux pump subunit AcrB
VDGRDAVNRGRGTVQIPIVSQFRPGEMTGLSDINNLYVYSQSAKQKVPAVPQHGVLASEVMARAKPALAAVTQTVTPGYKLEIGGEEEKQKDGFADLREVLATSIAAIFLALTFQFKNAIKPFIVFAAVPFGAIGAMVALWTLDAPFGFMAFLGVISLIGVIVSHIIVLFDFIEEKHAEGEPFEQAVLDAGSMRLRPVMITVGATVFGLFPLAAHGGRLWEALCYAQIGGLTAATFITLLLGLVFYAICVLDLKIVKWDATAAPASSGRPEEPIQVERLSHASAGYVGERS